MPMTFTDPNISIAPQLSGIYRLYRRDKLIYIGKAAGATSTIRSRLQDHKAGREGQCTAHATEFDFEVNAAPEAREEELLLAFTLFHGGRLPRCNEIMPTA